jgi:hypothetical protein
MVTGGVSPFPMANTPGVPIRKNSIINLKNFIEIYLQAWYISIIPPNMWLSLPEDKS